jgi:hypothetical protein
MQIELSGDEEFYFALSKKFLNKNWIPNSFNLDDAVGMSTIFQLIVGYLLKYFSFEQLAFFGKLVVYLILAYPLCRVIKLLQISNISAIFFLQIFFFPSQSFYGQGVIFAGIVPQTIAYVFVLFALYCLFLERYTMTTLLTCIATYFHILVAGWFFVAFVVYFLLKDKDIIAVAKLCLLYGLFCLPYVYPLFSKIILNGMSVYQGVSVDYIYSFVRIPHHTAPFDNLLSFGRKWLPGLLLSVSSMLLFSLLEDKSGDGYYSKIRKLNECVVCILGVSFLVAYFDRSGGLLKYHLFRLSPLNLLLTVLLGMRVIELIVREIDIRNYAMILVFIAILTPTFGVNLYQNVRTSRRHAHINDMIFYARANTSEDDVFLIDGSMTRLHDEFVPFIRKAERRRFIVFKFFPAPTNKTYEWYKRVKLKDKIIKDINSLFAIKEDYRLDYFLSARRHEHKGLKLVHQNRRYSLYRIVRDPSQPLSRE